MIRRLYSLICVLGLAGCSGSSGPPILQVKGDLIPIKGTVTLDGEPLANARVLYVFDGSPPAGFGGGHGQTDSSGKYQIRSGERLGVPAGRYHVQVELWTMPDGAPYSEQAAQGLDMEQAKMAGMLKQKVPVKYSDPMKTQLSAEVATGQSDPVDFNLKSK